MISRRTLLTGAAALTAYATVGGIRNAQAVTTGIIPCAIRWDPWYSQSGNARNGQNTVNPAGFQFRAPWFCAQASPNKLNCTGTQANMDTEIQLAAQAGIKCFAIDCYLNTPSGAAYDAGLLPGYTLYNSSAYKSLVKWCSITNGIGVLGSPSNVWSSNDWHASCDFWIPYFSQSNYQTVTVGTSNRPLFLLLWNATNIATYFQGSTANAAAAVTYLRAQCAAASIGNPYIVVLSSSVAAASATSIGADAISSYDPGAQNTALPNTYADLDALTQTFWATQAGQFANTMPICMTGWDRRPRYNMPESYAHGANRPFRGNLQYYGIGSSAQIATHIQAGIDYIGANPSVCSSKALLIYSWNECTEGGTAMVPTIGDPPVNAESGQALSTSNLLKAIGPVLRGAA